MTSPFETRAVAFLDVMGFKELIVQAEKSSEGLSKLRALRDLVDQHVEKDNGTLARAVSPDVRPRYLFVSDSIILSSKGTVGGSESLLAVGVKSIQIAHKLFELGYLLRGGIEIGSVWHDDKNIFGSGYSEAYLAEQKANHPRITLTDAVRSHLSTASIGTEPMSSWGLFGEYDGTIILETLNPAYISGQDRLGRTEDLYARYHDHILRNLTSNALGSSARSKWEWMAGFYNRSLDRFGIAAESFSSLPMPNT